MDAVDQAIVREVERVTHPATGAYSRVYPHQIAVYLPVRMSARAVRRACLEAVRLRDKALQRLRRAS